jgi:GGDEF domain-containing protein
VELNETLTPPHRKYLNDLAAEVAAQGSEESLQQSRAALRGLLRDYRDRAAGYLGGLRDELSSTAQALAETVESLSQCDTDHTSKLRSALLRLREAAKSSEAGALRLAIGSAADTIELSLEQMRKQHQFTISQFQTELRLLHARIDALETAASTDEATKFSNRRFLSEYLKGMPAQGALFLILKLRGLAEAGAKFGRAVADDLIATFARRLRNAIPKEAVVGRWSDQDFVAILPAQSAAGVRIPAIADHLSRPYACLLQGRIVQIPLSVTAERLAVEGGASADEIERRLTQAFP